LSLPRSGGGGGRGVALALAARVDGGLLLLLVLPAAPLLGDKRPAASVRLSSSGMCSRAGLVRI
jgi:hypothetical protein